MVNNGPFGKHRKILLIAVIIFFTSYVAFSQSAEWRLEHGKAVAEKTVTLSGKTSDDIYKEVNRWLVNYFKDPEDLLKARIEGEYLRGAARYSGLLKSKSISSTYLQYTFIFHVNEQEVTFKLTDAFIVYRASQGIDEINRIEEYFANDKKNRKNPDSEVILSSLEDFSNTLFQSFEKFLLKEDRKL